MQKIISILFTCLLFLTNKNIVNASQSFLNIISDAVGQLDVTSTSFQNNSVINQEFSKYGSNISPQISWSKAPTTTKSFAIILTDPDTIKFLGYEIVQWVVKNIPANVTSFEQGQFQGIEVTNMGNTTSYFGPIPPAGYGFHHYHFTVYALNVSSLSSTNYKTLIQEMQPYIVAKGSLVGLFEEIQQMIVTSKSFQNNTNIPFQYSKYGANISPQLSWSNAPQFTKSFALTLTDPDTKQFLGYDMIQWVVKNIPANVTSFSQGKISGGVEIMNLANTTAYFGPMPPKGKGAHTYLFQIYALDIDNLTSISVNDMLQEMQNHILGEGLLVGLFAEN